MVGVMPVNPTALRKAKIVYNLGLSECSRVKLLCVSLQMPVCTYLHFATVPNLTFLHLPVMPI